MSEVMTRQRLSAYRILNREISRTEERLARFKASPRGETESQKKKIKLIEDALKDYLADSRAEAAELLRYIESIEDPFTKEIFMLRYYDGIRSWQKISFLVDEFDESSVRRIHNAYLKAHPYAPSE